MSSASLATPMIVAASRDSIAPLSDAEFAIVQQAIDGYADWLLGLRLRAHVRRDFDRYVALRHAHGDRHINQAFDPTHTRFGPRDFWVLVEEAHGAAVATFCMRSLDVANVYTLIQSQSLWFSKRPRLVDPGFVVSCSIPPFGGRVGHGGGLWIRPDLRGQQGLVRLMPRFARALALRNHDIDHDSAMLLNSADPAQAAKVHHRAAAAARTYGFARAEPFVQGWFPPEQRDATMHLCHSTRAEAIGSLSELATPALAA